jgi:hypothetical protein
MKMFSYSKRRTRDMLRHPYTPNYHLIRPVDLEDERAWKYVKILDMQFYTQSICTHDTHTESICTWNLLTRFTSQFGKILEGIHICSPKILELQFYHWSLSWHYIFTDYRHKLHPFFNKLCYEHKKICYQGRMHDIWTNNFCLDILIIKL